MSNSPARAAPPGVVVISKNLHRRQLKDAEVIMIAAKVTNLRREETLKRGTKNPDVHACRTGKGEPEAVTVADAAVQSGRVVREKDPPELNPWSGAAF